MNCRPGDLAVIVRSHDVCKAEGRIIRLTTSLMSHGGPCWNYEEMPLRGRYGIGSWTWHEIPDEWLRPIRPQSDDATDEMVLIAGIPEQVTA